MTTEPIIGLGIDPGLRNTGIGAVARYPDGTYQSLGVRVSRTEPEKSKIASRVRAANDDQRRVRAHWVHIRNAIEITKPHAIGIENYLVFEPHDVQDLRAAAGDVLGYLGSTAPSVHELQTLLSNPDFLGQFAQRLTKLAQTLANNRGGVGLGQAAKTIAVFGAALAASYTAGVPVFVFQPSDLKQRFGGRKGASKDEVGQGLERLVAGLPEQMAEKVPQKTLKEHAWDSCGHAILAADEVWQYQRNVTPGSSPYGY